MATTPFSQYPKAQTTKSHDGSELTIYTIANFGDQEEVIPSTHRQFIKGRNYSVDCSIPFWKPDWLDKAFPSTFFAESADDPEFSLSLATRICIYRQKNSYTYRWSNQVRLVYGKLYPYHLKIIRPEDGDQPNKNLVAEAFPLLQAQQDHLQELIVSQDVWDQTWPNFVSFVGEIDTTTFTLNPEYLDDIPGQSKLCGFLQLHTYTNTSHNRAPATGYYNFHVFVIFPVAVNPWSSFWKNTISREDIKGPFQSRQLLAISGSIVGILSPDAIHQKVQDHQQILIIVPHSHHFIPNTGSRSASSIKRTEPTTPGSSEKSSKSSRFKTPVSLSHDNRSRSLSPTKAPQCPSTSAQKLQSIMARAPSSQTSQDDIASIDLMKLKQEPLNTSTSAAPIDTKDFIPIDDHSDDTVDCEKDGFTATNGKSGLEEVKVEAESMYASIKQRSKRKRKE